MTSDRLAIWTTVALVALSLCTVAAAALAGGGGLTP